MRGPKPRTDIIGKKFGRLTVVQYVSDGKWLCRCDCGDYKTIKRGHLGRDIFSCGCLKRELTVARETTHGETNTRLFNIWCGMNKRCYDENQPAYKIYGGRGITVCDEWRNDYVPFRDWALENGYRDDLSIDRKDNDGNYEPSNCRWATRKEQMRNRRGLRLITYNGETLCLSEWAEKAGISANALSYRLKKGASMEIALTDAFLEHPEILGEREI